MCTVAISIWISSATEVKWKWPKHRLCSPVARPWVCPHRRCTNPFGAYEAANVKLRDAGGISSVNI